MSLLRLNDALILAMKAVDHAFPDLQSSHLHNAIPPFHVKSEIADYGFAMLDVTIGKNGNLYLIEANGSNAALSSTSVYGDSSRVHHLVDTLLYRYPKMDGPIVVGMAYQQGFLHIPEFVNRAVRVVDMLNIMQRH